MLVAEIHGKISDSLSPNERMEDVLTSHVFSLLRYCTDYTLMWEFICNALPTQNNQDALRYLKSIVPKTIDTYFWPKFQMANKRRREPDIVLVVTGIDGAKTTILIEAKYLSGKSDVLVEDSNGSLNTKKDTNLPRMLGDQLTDDICGLCCGEWFGELATKPKSGIVIYLTSHYLMPDKELNEAIEAKDCQNCNNDKNECPALFWLSWRDLHTIVSRPLKGPTHSGEEQMLKDVAKILELRGLIRYKLKHDHKDSGVYRPIFTTSSWEIGDLEQVGYYTSIVATEGERNCGR